MAIISVPDQSLKVLPMSKEGEPTKGSADQYVRDAEDFFKDKRNLSELNLVGNAKELILVGKYPDALSKLDALVALLSPQTTQIIHDTSADALNHAASIKMSNIYHEELSKMILDLYQLLSDRSYYEARQKLLDLIAVYGGSPINFKTLIVDGKESKAGLTLKGMQLVLMGERQKQV